MQSVDTIKKSALDIGFDLVGVAPIAAWHDLEFSRQWVERGFSGEMRYLANPRRDDPRLLFPSVQSVVCVGLIYNAPLPYSTEVGKLEVRSQETEARTSAVVSGQSSVARDDGLRTTDEGPGGWISRYAWGRDYHEIMRAKLERLRAAIQELTPEVETRVFVDTGPIVERAFARLSGIGWMGKNTCLINQDKGSWFFLGVILTNLALAPDLPVPDRCGSCTRCIEACPTGALVEPYVMDASRCIAYFNIELKGSIPVEFREAIGANVFGCDICQDVCPWNARGSGEWQGASDRPNDRTLSVVRGQFSKVGNQGPEDGSQKSEARSQKLGVRSQIKNYVPGARSAATTALPEFQPLQIEFPSPESLAPSPCSSSPQPLAPSFRVSAPSTQHLTPSTFSLFNPPLSALVEMSEADFRRAFAKSPIKRVKYRGWLRNLCVAMGNSADSSFIPKLQELAAHSDPLVREHAAWALERLRIVKAI